MYLILGLCLLVPLVHAEEALIGVARQKRSNQYDQNQQQIQHQQLAPPTYQQHGNQQQQHHKQETYQKQEHGYKQKKRCYQCAYSPPKTIHSKKAIHVGQQGHSSGGPGVDKQQHQQYSYVAQTLHGGWDKCLGPFDHYQAKAYGVDSWDCHSGNCYTRRDSNGDVFRGCFKGEYGVDQHRYGCHYQGGSTYCFCEGELCNSGAAPNVPQH